MASRAKDWFLQARRDLEHARKALEAGHYEWACFAAQQAAEKAVKAVYQQRGGEGRGHSVAALLRSLSIAVPQELVEVAMELDRHYIPARYPNSHPQGAPYESYSRTDAERATGHASAIIQFCERHLV